MMLSCLLLMIVHIQYLNSIALEFNVKEDSKIGTVIGNIFSHASPRRNDSKVELIKNYFGWDSFFTLGKDTGDLVIRSIVDRETVCEDKKETDCIITLLADRDNIVIQIQVTIEDVNDNHPTFQSAHHSINIQENTPVGMTYFLPMAQDKDTLKYGINNYSISNFRTIDAKNREQYAAKDRYFRCEGNISPQLRVIGSIDREEISSFVFLFVASDVGRQSGSCTVTVIVTDVNDNSPEWKKDNYKVKIRECQSHGEIMVFDATDRDDVNTNNGRVTYRFSDRTKNREKISQIFYINGNKLYLSNNRPSDLSNVGDLMLFILAVDGDGRMTETAVEVMVEDCNDHAPIIVISKLYGEIMENSKEKLSLSIVNVKDQDRGKNGEFECVLNDSSVLSLVKRHVDTSQNNIIYKIETNGESTFDREVGAVYTVEIRCTDQGDSPLSSTQRFTVNVLDQNDNAPKFDDRTQIFYVTENNAIGSTIGHVRAADPDSGINGHVRYTVVKEQDYFTVSIYGEIQSKVRFDREEKDHYEFELLASDNGSPSLNDSLVVKVVITDENDCRPVFHEEYFFKVAESFGEKIKNEKLGEVKATDKDYGNNGTVHYKIVSVKTMPSGTVRVNGLIHRVIRLSSDGVISIYGNLDREVVSSIQLTIEASDNGTPKLSTETTVLIEVLDVNDNAPMFTFPDKTNTFLNVSLDSELGLTVGMVTASDPDQGANGTVLYCIVGADKNKNIPLKMETDGKLTVISDLRKYSKSRRLTESYSLKAEDYGTPPKVTIGKLFINYFDPSQVQSSHVSSRKSAERSNNNNNNNNYSNSILKSNKRNRLTGENYFTNSTISDSMILLYCLAAILFFIFIIVFSVLLYIYCSKTYTGSERLSKKAYKSNHSPIDSSHNMNELQHMTLSSGEFQEQHNIKSENGSKVCFLNDDGSSYTHLMMLNNQKYTPMVHPQSARQQYLRSDGSNQSDLISVSQNFLDCQFEPSTPQLMKASIKKFSSPNMVNSPESYCTLQDKSSFSSLSRTHKNRTVSSPGKQQCTLETTDFCQQQQLQQQQQQQHFNSPYVTSSFV